MQQGRFAAMLMGILKQEFVDPLPPSIEAWERAVLTYSQQSKEIIPEVIMTSVLCNGIKNDRVREHTTLNAARLVKHQEVRDELVRISMAARQWKDGLKQEVENIDVATSGSVARTRRTRCSNAPVL